MTILPTDLSSVISGILTLGAHGGEQIFLPKVHAILYQMKPHHRLLAGIWFSIAGSVCYSRDVENVIRDLSLRGVLRIENGSIAVVKNAGALRNLLRARLPVRQYKKIMAASRKFYALLRG